MILVVSQYALHTQHDEGVTNINRTYLVAHAYINPNLAVLSYDADSTHYPRSCLCHTVYVVKPIY